MRTLSFRYCTRAFLFERRFYMYQAQVQNNNIVFQPETADNPKMFQVYLNDAWHEVFCYGFAFEEEGYREGKLLFSVMSGSDSALQSIKGAIDVGSRGGLKFGHGVKTMTEYNFKSEKSLFAEKGKYEKFPMTLTNTRKGLAIVHEDILNNSRYVLSFESDPADDVAQLLGGPKYGLYILPEWRHIVLEELIKEKYLVKHDMYIDHSVFPDGLHLYSINLSEEEADAFLSSLIKRGELKFPKEGTGESVVESTDLTNYLLTFNGLMANELLEKVELGHDATIEPSIEKFDTYPRELFPVQAHTSTAVAKRLQKQKAVIIQGEMSTGKSSMMTAIADGVHALKNKQGYHACLLCPPSLTRKWPLEVKELLPEAEVHVIDNSSKLIKYHREWVSKGMPKPTRPTFFIISFTVMRDDARTVPAYQFQYRKTKKQGANDYDAYRMGYYCSDCGKAHQVVEDKRSHIDENGIEQIVTTTHPMTESEFGSSRRINNSKLPANAFCYHCGSSLWTKKVMSRYKSFKQWTKHEQTLIKAIDQGDDLRVILDNQKVVESAKGMPRRVATIEYIRRKMKNFFDISIVDEVHMLKGGMTAQGNSLGSLAAVSKKVVAGTGTLFGGKAEDIYYLLWRLFPTDMVKSGYQYEEVTRFNEEYGNIEETVIQRKEGSGEYSNTNSRGGDRKSSKKVLPGISPFIFSRYMIQNVINVRLKDVWPDPVDLIDTPTIFVPMPDELRDNYDRMISAFQSKIQANRKAGSRLYPQMTDYGIAYPDNPFTFPDALMKMPNGSRELIWNATHMSEEVTLPKEEKLQEIIQSEMSEGRASIVYVRDTGSSTEGRDIRPRLKQKLEEIGAKVLILDTSTVANNKRSEWLKQKIEEDGYDVCIVSQELVKVGLDLLCTPTLIFYQFSWSLFTINQAARRAWRIGQTEECRLFYLAYENSFQEKMAQIIAMKNRATAAINGEVSSDGLSAMLGDEGDLQSMLIQSVKRGGKVLKGSAEDFIAQSSDRARELVASIGKKRVKAPIDLLTQWIQNEIKGPTTLKVMLENKEKILQNIKQGKVTGFTFKEHKLVVDIVEALGFSREAVSDGAILKHLINEVESIDKPVKKPIVEPQVIELPKKKVRKSSKKRISDDQMAFDLFG